MSDDKSDKAGGWFSNPLPIVMVVLLAGGLLVKNVPLESARPTDPERVKFVATTQQDVEARLWQDPFAAVEKHEKNSDQAVTLPKNTLMMLFAPTSPNTSSASHRLEDLKKKIKLFNNVTVVAVSVFGGSYAEATESRRRSRFAVVSGLDFHDYHPENADALGYFHIDLPDPNSLKLTVPFEWFETPDKLSKVLVLWLNEDKFSTTAPLNELHHIFNGLTPHDLGGYLRVKLIGPAGSAMLVDLVHERENTDPNQKLIPLKGGITIEAFSSSATVSNCDLNTSEPSWNCFMIPHPRQLKDPIPFPIVRTTGTDDVLAAALLWELWQRGVNRDSLWEQIQAIFVKGQSNTSCADGLVLIGERDTKYGRTLLQYLADGFSSRCKANHDGNHDTSHSDMQQVHKPPVRTFSYLRGLDGVLPDIEKSSSKTSSKDQSSKSKDLREQLEDAPPEHAEGRSQFDYLRRLSDEIDGLDHEKEHFAKNGVKAIGIVGSDLYDKLLILQALRSRFQDKIFFTTDLDARYLHADQKDWARNLVVASNFGLSLHPALQRSTLRFRDSYQTSTYLATLMAIKDPLLDWTLGMENWLRPALQQSPPPYQPARYLAPLMTLNQPFDWTSKMQEWLRPHIFEIGRTQAVHLASPSAEDLAKWITSKYLKSTAPSAEYTKCHIDWAQCESIEPVWPSLGLSLEHLPVILVILILSVFLLGLTNSSVHQTVRTAISASSRERNAARTMIYLVVGTVVSVFIILAIVWIRMDNELTQGVGEPFVWLEGISVWPSLVIRFVGLVTVLALWYVLKNKMQQQKKRISEDFEIALQKPSTLARSRWSLVWPGPHLDLASFDREGKNGTTGIAGSETEVITLWKNYLHITSFREKVLWIVVCVVLVFLLSIGVFNVLGEPPSFPHRGQLVKMLHYILVISNVTVLWLTIFWAGYETRACVQFIKTLSNVPNEWPERLLFRKAKETGVPWAHLDDYLDFQLIVRATQCIHLLVYLPFVMILFMVLSRSNFFDAMNFPLPLVLVIGLALAFALYSARLLRKSADTMRTKTLENYELLRSTPTWPPISAEQINLLMDRIRNTHEGTFAPLAQQPALQALLLPFGGYGSVQLIEFLFKL